MQLTEAGSVAMQQQCTRAHIPYTTGRSSLPDFCTVMMTCRGMQKLPGVPALAELVMQTVCVAAVHLSVVLTQLDDEVIKVLKVSPL